MVTMELAKLLASGGLFFALLVANLDLFAVDRPLPGLRPAGPPAGAAAGPPEGAAAVARGRALFQAKGCVGCHTVAGVPGNAQVGPNLTGLPLVAGTRQPGTAAADYVRE